MVHDRARTDCIVVMRSRETQLLDILEFLGNSLNVLYVHNARRSMTQVFGASANRELDANITVINCPYPMQVIDKAMIRNHDLESWWKEISTTPLDFKEQYLLPLKSVTIEHFSHPPNSWRFLDLPHLS